MRLARSGRIMLLFATFAGVADARANGYQDLHQSAQGLGTAYAVNGTGITDISAMFSNPASLTRFQGSWFVAGTSLILPRDSFDNLTGTAPVSGVPLTGTPVEPKQFLDTTVGGSAFYSRQLSDKAFFGLALTVPWATTSEYPETAVSRYTAVDTDLKAYTVNPVIAYKINNAFSVAAGPVAQFYTTDFSTMVDATGGVAPAPITDVKSRIKGNDLSLGFIVGAEYQFTPSTRFGLSYRSAIVHEFDGKLTMGSSNPAAFPLLAANLFAATGITLTGPTGSASYKINTPSITTLGVAHQVDDRLELYGSAALIGWSRFKDTILSYGNNLPTTIVDNDWNDSWYLAVGGSYWASKTLQLRTGIAYDWTPTPDNVRNPRAPNGDRIYAGVGFTYKPNDKWKLDLAYNHCFFADAPINLAGGNNIPRGTLSGISKIDADILMAQVTFNLDGLFNKRRIED
jgi:long-chain fatty acid transport protein